MTFHEERASDFIALFDNSHSKIREMPGCSRLELWQDAEQPNIFTTYSWWDSDSDLQTYRESDLFLTTWEQAKRMFSARPEAYSYIQKRADTAV